MKRFGLILFIVLGLTILLPYQTVAQTGSYAALGDSVAAGSGLTGSSTICQRSPEAYPHIVAEETGLLVTNYACIGAKADEGIYDSQAREGTVLSAQLDQAFSSGTPKLITMTIGANDTRWTQFIRQCYYMTCGYSVDTARFSAYLVDLKLELNTILARIHTLSSGNPPQVIVTGYYNPFSSKTCSDTSELTSKEISWLKKRINKLNSGIRGTVSKYSYASFASVSFSGHELCATNSWVQGSTAAVPFHPTAAGQQKIADAVMDKYKTSSTTDKPSSYRERILNWYQRHRD